MNVINQRDADCVNAIRCIAPAVVGKANSGHPGAPMGCAAIAHALFGYVMNYSGKNPTWWARDRFVLSNGHASALQYTMLHLAGYELSMDDLKSFRQLGSRTPGHPERLPASHPHHTPGIEVTTGPLGQGFAQAVGLAIAAKNMKAEQPSLFDSTIFALCGEGCLQEGVTQEASSLAATLKLDNLVVVWDCNGISIDGNVDVAFTEDVEAKYRAYGWEVITVGDANNDVVAVVNALNAAKTMRSGKPVLVVAKTVIGHGSAKEGTSKVHGAPLAQDDLLNLRKACGFSEDFFEIPSAALEFYAERIASNELKVREWNEKFAALDAATQTELKRRFDEDCKVTPATVQRLLEAAASPKEDAPRNTSQDALRIVCEQMPELIGGSADLMESNKTDVLKQSNGRFCAESYNGRYVYFGIREHAMCAISNGIIAYGGFRSFNATFMNFYTYAWGAVRLSALSHFPTLMVATHDSIELGEDGPTHQPIEVAALCRATPNLNFVRPGDAREVYGSYLTWAQAGVPTMVALARGKVPNQANTSAEKVSFGAYVIEDFENNGKTQVIVASSGSELGMTVESAKILREKFDVRVVSMPSWFSFMNQTEEYQNSVFPAGVRAAIVEPYHSYGIDRYFDRKISTCLDTFGLSAPAAHSRKELGFTPEAIAQKVSAGF